MSKVRVERQKMLTVIQLCERILGLESGHCRLKWMSSRTMRGPSPAYCIGGTIHLKRNQNQHPTALYEITHERKSHALETVSKTYQSV